MGRLITCAYKHSMKTYTVRRKRIKGALNPNFLNLTINREKFCL